MNGQRAVIVSVDGNIGSGKSTTGAEYENYVRTNYENNQSFGDSSSSSNIFSNISSIDEICFLDEPVSQWSKIRDKDGVDILTNLYKDTKAHAFKFQMMAYISRLALLRRAVIDPKIKLIITERSVETDRNVFAKMLYDVGDISEDEFQIYTLWFDEFINDVKLSGIVYVNASPHVCIDRIKQRARPGETIHAEYIQRCHDYHENWINNKLCPVLTLPANDDVIGTPELLKIRINLITQFINELLNKH
jgi:deoxyadenosine/deoxycytidine kinase